MTRWGRLRTPGSASATWGPNERVQAFWVKMYTPGGFVHEDWAVAAPPEETMRGAWGGVTAGRRIRAERPTMPRRTLGT